MFNVGVLISPATYLKNKKNEKEIIIDSESFNLYEDAVEKFKVYEKEEFRNPFDEALYLDRDSSTG